jgi:dTDP-4-dehydrorhamnose reductase
MRIIVLGATGMLGSSMFQVLANLEGVTVFGTVRSAKFAQFFKSQLAAQLLVIEDLEDFDALQRLIEKVRPQVVINCVALRKSSITDPMKYVSIFSLLPRRLSYICRRISARLILISSDGVFSGARGNYVEEDRPDATDLYGIAKILGEVAEPNNVILRTSIIGHELQGKSGLLEWFLSQDNRCQCYTQSIFSGFPTVALAQIIRDVVIPRVELQGVYHVATQPISKYDLLKLVAARYNKCITLVSDDSVAINRSLSSKRFTEATGYIPPDWTTLIDLMYTHQKQLEKNNV